MSGPDAADVAIVRLVLSAIVTHALVRRESELADFDSHRRREIVDEATAFADDLIAKHAAALPRRE